MLTLHKSLKNIRESKGLSRSQIAGRIGSSVTEVQRIETSDIYNLNNRTIIKYIKALNLELVISVVDNVTLEQATLRNE